MEQFMNTSFGFFLMNLVAHYFIPQSLQSFMMLAFGWSLTSGRHTISTYLLLSGATSCKHFSRYYEFISGRFYRVMDRLWARLILRAERLIPPDQPLCIKVDSTTKKKSGQKIQGRDCYRNGAGTARQEYRTLLGLHFVYAILEIPLQISTSAFYLKIPIGLKLYVKAHWAKALNIPFQSKSQLARAIIDPLAMLLPQRCIRVTADGGFATKIFLRDLPQSVDVIGRFPVDSKLYQLPKPRQHNRRGRKPVKGNLIGSPITQSQLNKGFRVHPTEKDAFIKIVDGIWHSVLPGKLIRVVIVKRINPQKTNRKVLEAFFSTDTTLNPKAILSEYHRRWDIEIDIRDANTYYGLGQDHCRKYRRIVGINNFRMFMAAARTLFCIEQLQNVRQLNLSRYRPWYRQKKNLSQLDIQTISRELLLAQGIFPTPCFLQDVHEIIESYKPARIRAA